MTEPALETRSRKNQSRRPQLRRRRSPRASAGHEHRPRRRRSPGLRRGPGRPGLAPLVALALGLALACAQPVGPGSLRESERPSAVQPSEGTPLQDPPGPRVHPLFFRVDGGAGARLWLLGTIHAGPPGGWRLPPSIMAALAEADTLVLEVDLREATEEHVSNLVANIALLEPGTHLDDRISPETRKLLAERDTALATMGFPGPMRRLMKPWFLAVGVIESQVQRTPYTAEAALDRQLFEAFGEGERIGLETVAQQLDLFDEMSPTLQDVVLRDVLARFDEGPESVEALVSAWRTGDEARLEVQAREGVDALPELEAVYAVLLDERNRRWLHKLERLLESPVRRDTRAFVGVGALHLVGRAGLPALLRQAGYRVERIDPREER